MRKFIALLLLALPTVLGFSIRAVAVGEKFTVQELVYMVTKDPIYTVNGAVGEAVLTWKNAPETSHQAGRYNSTYPSLPKKLVVPPMVVPPSSGNSYRVVGVGNSAFHSCAGIDTVLIPSDNRFRIEQNAFRYCTSLREVLGYEAEGSGNNWSVQEVHTGGFAASVDSLGENAFEACGFDTLDFTLPSPYRLSLSAGVFAGCPSLKALLAGSRLRRVGTNAFRASSELRFVEFDQQSLTAGVELSLEAGAFPASGSIEAIHLRYSQPPTLPAAGLGAVFGGLKETMKLYLPFRYLNIYEGWGGESVRDHIESSYAVHIPNPLKWVYAQRDTVMAYDLTYCGKPLNRKSAVVWQNELHDVAVVGVSCSPEQVCKLTLTSYQEGKTWIWGRFPDELTNGEGAQADSFRLTVRNPVEVVVKRKGTLIQNGDTLFIRVGEKDTLTTGINSYGLPTSDVPEMLWTELHKVKDKDGAGYIRRTVLPAAALSVIEPLGHDTVTYTVRAKAGSAALATFTVISPRMALTIAKRGNDNKKSDTIDVFRATILSVKDTTGTEYPYSWKILANTDTLGKPVADTLTLADKSLRVKARRPGTFRITVSTTALDSLPAIDTFTVLVRKPEIDVHIAVAKYDHLSSDGTTITVPVNHTDTLYANVKAFNKEVWKIKNIGDIQAMYGIPGSEALEPDEWLQDDPDKVAQYIGELNGSGLVKWGKKSNDKAFLFGDMDKDSIWVNPIDHKGGKTELYLEYTCFGRSRRDTVTVLALPVQVEIQAETQRGYMNRKDTLSVNIRYAEDYAAQGGTNATGGTAQPSVTINQPAVDTVLWKSLDERIARVNDAGIVSFLDTGTVSICAVTSKKASLSDYKGVGDTVVFRIYAPEIGIRFFRKADDGAVVPVTKDSPFTIKKGPDGQDSIWAEISIDGLLVTDSLALHWDCAAGFEDTIIVSTHNTDDRVGDTLHITGRKHKGGSAALWATTTLKHVSPWYNADPEVEPSILRRYTASSDTVEVEVWPLVIDIVDEQGVPVSDTHPLFEGMYTVKGHVVYRDDATPVVVDSVKWEVISPAKADIMTVEPKGEACTLRFTESGVVRLRATVMWKDSKGAFQEGVSDTVEFTVPVPNLELRLYSVRTGGFEIDKTYPPFYLRLYGSEKISVKLSRDNNPISPDDPLMAQLKGFVLDSTVVAIEKIELDGGVVRHDTFKVTALAHKEKATKVWVGDSLEISGKKYAINCVDTLRVEVAPIHLKITDDSPQNGAILFQNRPYEWQAEATFADHTPVTPTPHVTWKASQGTLTAQTDGDGNTKWCLTDTGTVMVWAETYYETKVGDRDTIICGVASDTVTVKVPAPKIDIEVGTGLVFGSQRRMRPVVHSDGELTDTLGLRWISRNERIVTVNEDGNGDVYFIPNDVQSCAWVVVEAYYRHDPAKRMLAVDSSEICIDDAVMKIILLNNEEPAQTQVKLNREREFTVAVIYNGDTLPAPYDKQLIWEVWPIDEVEAIKCFDWDSLAMKIKIRGIAAGKSELVPSVKNVSGNFVKTNTIPFEVPKPILAVKVNKVKHPQEEVIQLYLDSLGGEEKELYATVVSDGEDLAKPDSIEIIWEVSDPSVLYLFSSTAENTPEIGSSTPEIRAKSNNMRIWAKGSGAVTVTARTEGGISLAEWAVAVAEPPVTVAFDKQNYGPMQIEKTLPLPVPTVKSYGKVTTKYAVTWESLNTEVLEVNGTEIYARNVGEAWLVARVRGLVVQRPADSVLVTVLHPDVQITFTPGPGELPMLKRKETCLLRATVKVNGVERTDIPVRWHSSRADVATVTPTASDGQTVTLQASSTPTLTEGERTTIAAEILSRWGNKDGGPWLKQVDVFVDKSDVLVEPAEVALRVGESKLLSGYKTMIDNVSAALGSFASSPEGVVSVNEDGMVTALKEGTGVAIYAYVLNPVDNTPFVSKQIATLTVSPREIEMTPKGFLMSVKQDSAKVFPSVQVIVNDVEVFPTADAWESSKPAVAKLTLSGDDPALVQAIEGVSPGSADIRLIVDGDKRTVFTVTVPERIYEISPIEKPIKIKNGSVWSLSEVAQNIGLSTVVDGTALGAADRLWTSSEPAVLTVDDGKMTAVANGEAAVTVTVKGRTATVAMVTVYTPVVTVTPLNYQMWVKLDSTIPFPAVKIVDDGKELSPAACLQSSDYTVAALSDDALSVTGNKEGSAEIYAEVEGKRYVLFKVIVPKQTFSVTPINQQLVLKVGEQRTLAVLAAVDGTEMTDNYWYSSNPGVVPVAAGEDAAHRVITGLKAGQADIKVVVKDSTFIVATVDVPEPIYTLTLSGASSILQHMEDTLFAAVKCDGNLVNGILPRWEAPEGLILSAQTGDKVAVRALTPGAYTVVATLEGVQPPVSAEYAVVVPEPVITVSIPEHLDTIDSRASVRLVAEVTLNGIVVDTIPVTFDVLTPDLADKVLGSEGTTSVSIYGKKTGEVTVRATLHGGSILSNLCTFFIRKPKVTILASAASHTINVRGTFTPYVEVEYSPGKINVGMANERWSASDTSIISVDSITGRVTGRKAGVADLTVRIPEGGVSEPFTVTVLPPTIKVRIQGGARIDSAEIRLGQMLLLEADAIYNGNVSESNVKATWTALNPLVVDVDGLFGVVTAQQTGVTWVEVLTADGGKASVKIHVLNPFVVITTTAATDTVRVGETILLKAYVGYDYDSRIPDVALTWTVEPRNIASVNGGLVTGLQKGTAVVTATAPAIYGAEWATYEVVVSGLPTAIGALPEERYAARIESDGLRLTGFSPQDEVTVYTLGGRILLRAQAGDGFIPHAFSYGVYIVRTAKGNVKAVFLR